MNESIKKVLAFTSAAIILGVTWIPVAAADEGGFRLWVEPVSIWALELEQDTNSSKFQEYRDLGSGVWAGLEIGGESADGDRTFGLDMEAIGRDHARYTLDYGLAGEYAVLVDYNKIPHRFGNDATLLWNQTAVNKFELADSIQQVILDQLLEGPFFITHGFLSPLMQPYFDVANRVDLGLQRNRTNIQVDVGKLGKMAWSFEYAQENRDGNRPMGASFGFFNVQEIPEPVRYKTTSFEISGERSYEKGGFRFGYRHSEFENDLSFVTWDNPFRPFDSTSGNAYLGPVLTREGPSQGRTSLPPDNDADLLFADVRGRAGTWWYSGSVALNTMSQNDPILPFTINTSILGENVRTGEIFNAATGGLPITEADTEVEVVNLTGAAGTSLGDRFDLSFRLRSYDYDNTSPRVEFPGWVRLDSAWEAPALLTVPYDYTRDNFSVELGWQATDTTEVSLAYLLESWDRTFRETESSDEDTIRLSVDSRPNQKVTLRASYAKGDRTTSDYDVAAQNVFFVEPHGINNQPDLRKYGQAERDVDDYAVQVQLFPSEAWNVSFGISGRDEDYGQSVFGLIADETTGYNFEVGYTPGAHLNVYLFGHTADRDVFQRARQSGGTLSTDPQNDWSALLSGDTATWGLGLNSERDSGWTWDVSAHLSDSDGEADFETLPGGTPAEAVDIDNYEDIELLSVWVKAGYEVADGVGFGLFYLYEDYTIDSFIQQGIVPYLPSAILLAANDGDYQADLFGVNLRLEF